jgi:hypothetical protein
VIRRALAAGLSVVLQTSALTLPLLHAHPDAHGTPHHAGRTVHAHFSGHTAAHLPTGHPVVGDDDHDRAVYLQLFVAVPAQPAPVAAAAVTIVQPSAPRETAAHVPVAVVHGHDPPFYRSLAPRAPPSFLS